MRTRALPVLVPSLVELPASAIQVYPGSCTIQFRTSPGVLNVRSTPETEAVVRTLRQGGAMGHTTVVAAPAGAPLGERFAALSAAAALGERVRDAGGHALVVLDDISCMVPPKPAQLLTIS